MNMTETTYPSGSPGHDPPDPTQTHLPPRQRRFSPVQLPSTEYLLREFTADHFSEPQCPCRRRCTAHTTTSLSEQISLSFRLSPKPNQALADRRKAIANTGGKEAALASAKQWQAMRNGSASGHAADAGRAEHATVALAGGANGTASAGAL